jgi:hypothetical protein
MRLLFDSEVVEQACAFLLVVCGALGDGKLDEIENLKIVTQLGVAKLLRKNIN